LDDSPEAIFRMKPAAVIETLARLFVAEQRKFAELRRLLATLPADADAAAVQEMSSRVDALVELWMGKQVPNLAASFRLALEVLDTYGPDGVDVEDRTDAEIWNNKYFVWLKEFGGEPPTESGDGDSSS